MKGHRWLHRRGRNYYLRAFVPRDLIAIVGKKEIWKSLRTSQKTEATRRLRPMAKDVTRLFVRARQNRDSLLAARKPRRKNRLRVAEFQSAEETFAHDLKILQERWGKYQSRRLMPFPFTKR